MHFWETFFLCQHLKCFSRDPALGPLLILHSLSGRFSHPSGFTRSCTLLTSRSVSQDRIPSLTPDIHIWLPDRNLCVIRLSLSQLSKTKSITLPYRTCFSPLLSVQVNASGTRRQSDRSLFLHSPHLPLSPVAVVFLNSSQIWPIFHVHCYCPNLRLHDFLPRWFEKPP